MARRCRLPSKRYRFWLITVIPHLSSQDRLTLDCCSEHKVEYINEDRFIKVHGQPRFELYADIAVMIDA